MTFNCIPHLETCKAQCCGKRIHTKRLWKLKSHYAEYVTKVEYINNMACITTKDNMCPFLCRKVHRCKIYNNRPSVCKQFGETKGLLCAFQGRLGFKRSIAKRTKILREQKKKVIALKQKEKLK